MSILIPAIVNDRDGGDSFYWFQWVIIEVEDGEDFEKVRDAVGTIKAADALNRVYEPGVNTTGWKEWDFEWEWDSKMSPIRVMDILRAAGINVVAVHETPGAIGLVDGNPQFPGW